MSGSFGLDYYSFPLRRAGHIVAATGDTLLEGEVARLLLYRLGGRRNLRRSDRWNPYLEGGVGLGAANAPFATSDSAVYGGAGGVLVGSLFVGTGVRTNGRGPIGGFGALRLDGVHSLLWGQWGLVVSARVGLT